MKKISPRPYKHRRVEFEPEYTYFKPAGIPLLELEESALTIVELEAIRLKDFEGFDQVECAKKMNISRPTFQRILSQARAKIAQALILGKAIRIEGGIYELAVRRFGCAKCNYTWEAQYRVGTTKPKIECPKCQGEDVRMWSTEITEE